VGLPGVEGDDWTTTNRVLWRVKVTSWREVLARSHKVKSCRLLNFRIKVVALTKTKKPTEHLYIRHIETLPPEVLSAQKISLIPC
jgi:hypothetical protein